MYANGFGVHLDNGGERVRNAVGNVIANAGDHIGGVAAKVIFAGLVLRRVSVQRGSAALARQWRPAHDCNVQRLTTQAEP